MRAQVHGVVMNEMVLLDTPRVLDPEVVVLLLSP